MTTIQTAIVADGGAMAEFAESQPPAEVGAVVTFYGMVRDNDHGRDVRTLEYEAHPSANEVLRTVGDTISARHPDLSTLRVAHRIGLLHVGDCALFAEVGAPHRAEAFTACSALVDEVKRVLPVWKLQTFHDGTDEWVNSA